MRICSVGHFSEYNKQNFLNEVSHLNFKMAEYLCTLKGESINIIGSQIGLWEIDFKKWQMDRHTDRIGWKYQWVLRFSCWCMEYVHNP